jgi:hypothetical protein
MCLRAICVCANMVHMYSEVKKQSLAKQYMLPHCYMCVLIRNRRQLYICPHTADTALYVRAYYWRTYYWRCARNEEVKNQLLV